MNDDDASTMMLVNFSNRLIGAGCKLNSNFALNIEANENIAGEILHNSIICLLFTFFQQLGLLPPLEDLFNQNVAV